MWEHNILYRLLTMIQLAISMMWIDGLGGMDPNKHIWFERYMAY